MREYATTNSTEIIVNNVEAQARPFHIEAVIHSIRTVIVIHLFALVYLVLANTEDLKVSSGKKSTHSMHFSLFIDSFQLSFLKNIKITAINQLLEIQKKTINGEKVRISAREARTMEK